MIGGLWLPAVAGIERTPVYIGDYERAVSGVLRTAHVGKAMEWRVLLQDVDSEHVEALEEVLRSPVPVGCNIMGTEVIASVTELSSAHNPKRHGPDADWGRMNYEILVREVVVEQIMPGFTYEYEAFLSEGPFVWDWDAAGQPDEVDVLLVAGGGGGASRGPSNWWGTGGGGAGGVLTATGVTVTGDVTGVVGAGGASGTNGEDTTFGVLTAIGGGHGGTTLNPGGDGGSGGGGHLGNDFPPGAGTPGQGHAGGTGSASATVNNTNGGGGGGGGAGAPGGAGKHASQGSGGGAGGLGVDLLAVGWNYRLVPGVPRHVGGGGGGSSGRRGGSGGPAGPGGIGGGGTGGTGGGTHPTAGTPNTGGGGGGGRLGGDGAPGGSGLVIVRWLVKIGRAH